MDNSYGDDYISYQFFESKPVGTFTSIEFRNGGDNWNTSFIIDAMTESLIKGQMDNGVQAYRPCVLYMNGEYWGIHNLRERTDKQYFASNFGVDPNGIEHLGYSMLPPNGNVGLEVFDGKPDDYNSFLSFAENNDLSQIDNYNYIKSQMDIGSFIDYISTEVYVCNTSWGHNREWWRAKNNDAKWRWLINDIDRGFNLQNINVNTLSSMISGYSLFNRLLQNNEFKNNFIQQFAAHLNSTFTANRVDRIVDSLSSEISTEMPRHIEKWKSESGIQSMQAWQNELDKIKQFAASRPDVVFDHLNTQFGLSGTTDLSITLNNPVGGKIFVNGIPLSGNLTGMKFFKNIPLYVKAVPNTGYRFLGWQGISDSDSISLTLTGSKTITAVFEVSGEIIIPSKIDQNLVLNITGGVYTTAGNITVAPNVTLKIEKGIRINMPENASIYVKGNLIVEGTQQQPVSICPDSISGAASWGALCFDNTTDTNYISYLNITGATHGSDIIVQKAAVSCNNSNVILDNISIDNVPFPMYAQYGSTVIKNSSFTNATNTCDYIGIQSGKVLIVNNTLIGNKSPDTDGIDFNGDTDCIIQDNRIYNFNGFNSDAIDIGEQSKQIIISGNIIYNSTDKGISVGQLSDVIVERNVIVGCDMGIAVKDSSYASISNNTFFGNNYAVACYVKNYGKGGGFADVKNSILSASKTSSILTDTSSMINISYSLSDMDYLPGDSNIFGDPSFVNEEGYNFQLKSGSICIDAGSPDSPKDLDG